MSEPLRPLVLLALLALAASAPLPGQSVPTGFIHETLCSSFPTPSSQLALTDLAALPDGRVLVLDRNGSLYVHVPGTSTAVSLGNVLPVPSPFVLAHGLAIDPDFAVNGRIYVAGYGSSMRFILRRSLTGDLAASTSVNLAIDPGTERLILQTPPTNGNGNASLRFGIDGKLRASFPADGILLDAADRTTLPGTVVRLDVANVSAGAGPTPSPASLAPPDNPFAGSSDPEESLAIAWGLRVGYNLAIDPLNDDVFIDEFAPASGFHYETNQLLHGSPFNALDFGYPYRIGTSTQITPPPGVTGLVDPIFEAFTPSSATVLEPILTAGVYRNFGGHADWGGAYEGRLFIAVGSQLRSFVFDYASLSWLAAAPDPGQPNATDWATLPYHPSRCAFAPDGSLLLLTLGSLSRIRTAASSRSILIASGGGQVGVKDIPFGAPIVAEVRDVSGAPLAGVPVHFTVTNGSVVGSPVVLTDSAGLAGASFQSSLGGALTVTARANYAVFFAQAPAFTRRLTATVAQSTGQVVMVLTNTSNGTAPVPFILAMTLDTVPLVPTPFGVLGVSILDGNGTIVIEDPLGILNGAVNQGGFGTPGKASFYSVPPWLTGIFRLQAIVVDPTVTTSVAGVQPSDIGLTNIVTLNL